MDQLWGLFIKAVLILRLQLLTVTESVYLWGQSKILLILIKSTTWVLQRLKLVKIFWNFAKLVPRSWKYGFIVGRKIIVVEVQSVFIRMTRSRDKECHLSLALWRKLICPKSGQKLSFVKRRIGLSWTIMNRTILMTKICQVGSSSWPSWIKSGEICRFQKHSLYY